MATRGLLANTVIMASLNYLLMRVVHVLRASCRKDVMVLGPSRLVDVGVSVELLLRYVRVLWTALLSG